MTDSTDGWWDIDHVYRMIRDSADDESGFLLAANTATPAELRNLATRVDVDNVDSLRELSVAVTVAVRQLNGPEEQSLRAWVALRAKDRRAAARQYLARQNRSNA